MENAGGVFSVEHWDSAACVQSPAAPWRQKQPTRKVAILGFGRTVKDCPWQDPSWELWGMNGFWRAAEPDFGITAPEERYALWFDLHTIEYTREYGRRAGFGERQELWLQGKHPFPILMLDESEAFPCVKRFPIELVLARTQRDYMTSTVAHMLAYALAQEDIAEIGLWGIDLVHDTEYSDQRPCAEYWIGRLESAGIKVSIHSDSALLKQRHRYGYEEQHPLIDELRVYFTAQHEGLTKSIAKAQADMEALRGQLHTDDGAAQIVREALTRLDVWQRGGKV